MSANARPEAMTLHVVSCVVCCRYKPGQLNLTVYATDAHETGGTIPLGAHADTCSHVLDHAAKALDAYVVQWETAADVLAHAGHNLAKPPQVGDGDVSDGELLRIYESRVDLLLTDRILRAVRSPMVAPGK